MTNILGVDLGTGMTKCAIMDDTGNPVMLPQQSGELAVPSVVYFDRAGPIVGNEAVNASLADPARGVSLWKRHMGTEDVLFTDDDGTEYRAADIARILLERCCDTYEAAVGTRPVDVAASVPANYTDLQKDETKAAVESLGAKLRAMPHEPTAAALGSGFHRRGDGLVLVSDLGCGTYDASLAEVSGNNIAILCTDGEPDLGGADFNDRLIDHLVDRFEAEFGKRPQRDDHPLEWAGLVQLVEQSKVQLSVRERTPIFASFGGKILNTKVDRAKFESLTQDLVERAIACMERTLRSAGVRPDQVREILPIGGASKMPLFARMIESRFGKPVSRHVDPHYAAAKGNVISGRLAMEREGRSVSVRGRRIPPLEFLTRDVTSHPIGVKVVTDEGRLVNSVILAKGAPIPSDRTEPFLLAEAGQTDAHIQLLQGDDGADPDQCLDLGHFELTGLEPADGDHRIEIRLKIDRHGMLSSTAYDPVSGRSTDMTVDYRKHDTGKKGGRP